MMNQLKSIYNSPFKESQLHPIHTCFRIIASKLLVNLRSQIPVVVGLQDGDFM